MDAVRRPFRQRPNHRPSISDHQETIWALRDVCFEVKQGDVIGVIGRNGAGKSTLLKILSRITDPTEGRAIIRGRVGSMLEVGTGFHPELTGRENIYLNGALLGMRRDEIARKFDEIVSFAEIETFLDTPVKHYSSGMYVRLAFAVVAHLDPEILVVDEVLAVGDDAFQKKCLGKMEDVSKRKGKTVLFVSHNMRSILQLCNRGILLSNGKIIADGHCREIVETYLGTSSPINKDISDVIRQLPPDPSFCLDRVDLTQNGRAVNEVILNGDPLEIIIRYRVLQDVVGLRVYLELYDSEELLIFRTFHDENNTGIVKSSPGRYISKTEIPANLLAPIRYELRINSGIYNVRQCIPPPGVRIPLVVEATGNYNRAYPSDTIAGRLAPALGWSTRKEPDV
jgi:lipopolysaccharide transport system ATP-binding protein